MGLDLTLSLPGLPPFPWQYRYLLSGSSTISYILASPSTSYTSLTYECSYRSLLLPTSSSQSTSDISQRGTIERHRETAHSISKHQKEIFSSSRLFSMVKIRISDTFTIKEHHQKQRQTERKIHKRCRGIQCCL